MYFIPYWFSTSQSTSLNKKCYVNEETAPIVLEIFTKYANGYTAKDILDDLTARGIKRPNGTLLNTPSIYQMLKNQKYIGIAIYEGKVYDNIFPRLVPDEIWRKVQEIHGKNVIGPGRKKDIFDFLLSGKLLCGLCHQRMRGSSGTSQTSEKHYYYVCDSRKKNKAQCKTKAIRKEYLEDIIINTTVKMLKDELIVHKIAEM